MPATDELDSPQVSLLLPNLPDDVALQCIARVPRFYHSVLSLVSKSWHSMLRSPLFFSIRGRLNCTQHSLYLNVYNGSSSKWFVLDPNPSSPRNLSPVPSIPSQHWGYNCVVLGSEIYVLGGFVNDVPSSIVWIFDCRFNRWEIGPKMCVERASFAACVLNGKIYVMGGCFPDSTNWAEVFDPALGCWALIPSTPEFMFIWGTAVMEERFYAITDRGGLVFDPCDSSWGIVSSELLDRDWRGQACVVDEILYYSVCPGEIRGFDVKDGRRKELKWVQKDLPAVLPNVRMANVGGRLYLVWDEREIKGPGCRMKIACAEIEVRKDSNGVLWGSVVWSEVILVISLHYALLGCLAVEL